MIDGGHRRSNMPLKVTDLKPGDRVMLNCPKSRLMAQREAEFEGIYPSIADAMNNTGLGVIVMGSGTQAFLNEGKLWAAFLFQTSRDPVVRLRHSDGSFNEIPNPVKYLVLRGAFQVEPDGTLREEEGRRIYIAYRLPRPTQG